MILLRAIIFLNGDYSKQSPGCFQNDDLIIAVDGGAKYLLDNGIRPHMFVGDADSIDGSLLKKLETLDCKLHLYPQDKEKIDAQLAIEKAIELGTNEIIIRGWQGERVDMILALIYLMCKYPNVTITAKDDNLQMGIVHSEMLLDSVKGEKWSILPACGNAINVTLRGFKYELTEAYMPYQEPFGISNIAMAEKVKIKVQEGMVVYFRWIKQPL